MRQSPPGRHIYQESDPQQKPIHRCTGLVLTRATGIRGKGDTTAQLQSSRLPSSARALQRFEDEKKAFEYALGTEHLSDRVAVSAIHGHQDAQVNKRTAGRLRSDLGGRIHILILSIKLVGVGSNILCGLPLSPSVFVMGSVLQYDHFLQIVARHWRFDWERSSDPPESGSQEVREAVLVYHESQIDSCRGRPDPISALLQSRMFVHNQHTALGLEPPQQPTFGIRYWGSAGRMQWQGLSLDRTVLRSPATYTLAVNGSAESSASPTAVGSVPLRLKARHRPNYAA